MFFLQNIFSVLCNFILKKSISGWHKFGGDNENHYTIFFFQTERDVSVRQRAVDLLYAMCDRSNAEEIVGEMLEYLESADYSIREEMVNDFDSIHYTKSVTYY